ncbi:MAG: sun protein [Gemmatimonadetes bacterium]|nr:sun protein [Gemmatimonadota bacterium]
MAVTRRASTITEARIAAADVCADIRRGELLDPSFDRRTSGLDARDRRWTRELVYGMLRRRSWIDALLDVRVKGGLQRLEPGFLDLMRLGTYQLLEMGSVPAYAAIGQTVELAKVREGIGAGGLANAVLRRIDRERGAMAAVVPADAVDALVLSHSHPRWLVDRWIARFGMSETEALLEANNREAPLIARPVGVDIDTLRTMLSDAGVSTEPAPLLADSVVMTSALSLHELGVFRQGLFHLQDPASTLVTKYADVPQGATVIDLCAAPGGKSVELARHAGLVISCDLSPTRIARVMENRERLAVDQLFAVVADARMPAVRPADLVLVDAPCTGTGTFRRHPDARWRLRISDLAVLGALQRSILRAAAGVVRPGGILVYSTCSLEPEENDEQVDQFLAEHPDFALEAPSDGAVPETVLDAGRLRVLPQRHGTDGAFAARMRRAA